MTNTGTPYLKTAAQGAICAFFLLVAPTSAHATQVLAETVNLRPEIAKSLCMDFKSAARLAECDGSSNQKITLTRRDTPAAERIMRVGQKCIEAGNEGRRLFLASCRNVRNQTWSYTSTGQIKNGNGLCIDVQGAAKTADTPVIAYRCTGQVNQRWAKYDPAEAVAANADVVQATLRPEIAQDKCLDLTSDGRLVTWPCHGGKNQTFAFANKGSGRIMVNGKCLVAPRNGNGPIRGVACDTQTPEQFWTVSRSGTIQNRNGRCADVAGSRTADGTEILSWTCTYNRNQKFRIR